MLVVGLTGGVASGKTAVSQVLREEGATILDADLIARELVEPHQPAWEELRRAFGDEVLNPDGSVQRKKLAAQIFSHPEKREVLNAILHPRIRDEINTRLRVIREKDPGAIVVIDAALLVESGVYLGMDGVIVVYASDTQQVERLRERVGLNEDAARQILASQTSVEERLRVADFVIRNEGSLEDTRRRAKEVFQALKKMALRNGNPPSS